MPHYGMNNAGVIYEAPVEGGINRYMAIIEDYDDLERIGSVRSCRTYYTYFAKEFEAVYAHFGQSVFALPYLENVDNINGIEGLGGRAFYRTSDKKAPHNAYTSGERVKKAMEEMGYDSAYPESYEGHFLFADKPNLLEDERDATYVAPGYPINAPGSSTGRTTGSTTATSTAAPQWGQGPVCGQKYYFPVLRLGLLQPDGISGHQRAHLRAGIFFHQREMSEHHLAQGRGVRRDPLL